MVPIKVAKEKLRQTWDNLSAAHLFLVGHTFGPKTYLVVVWPVSSINQVNLAKAKLILQSGIEKSVLTGVSV